MFRLSYYILIVLMVCSIVARPNRHCADRLKSTMVKLCPHGWGYNEEIPSISKQCCENKCTDDFLKSFCLNKNPSSF